MAKGKSNPRQYKLSPWLSANEDNKEGRFIMVGNSMLLHKLKKVKPGPFKLYMAMCMECGGKLTFSFSYAAAKKYGIAPTSYENWRKILIDDEKLIEKVESEEMGRFETPVYRFKLDWKKEKSV